MEKKDEELTDLVKLSFFAEMGKKITSTTTVTDTCNEVMEQIGTIFAPEHWSLMLRNVKTGELTFSLVTGAAAEKLLGLTIPRGHGVAGWIAENGQAVIIEDVSQDSRFDPSMDRASGFTTKSIIGVPLKTKNKVFGVIELINKINGDTFTPLELKVLSTIADFSAIAIEKAYYFSALKRIATIDPLTGACNRRSFFKSLQREKERCKRYGSPFSIIMIDVDKFKEINDNHGHVAGDSVLKTITRILSDSVRKADIVCRYGGDEFIVLMPESGIDGALEVKNRILARIQEANRGNTIQFSVSIGIHEATNTSLDDILHNVDEDLYRDKNSKEEQTIDDVSEHIETFFKEHE